jgi:uncharacterized membrane protein YebE (DUF533 family)
MHILALLLSLFSLAISGYAAVETIPNYQDARRDYLYSSDDARSSSASYDYSSNREEAQLELVGGAATALLGGILGMIARRKNKGGLATLAVLMALGGAAGAAYIASNDVF